MLDFVYRRTVKGDRYLLLGFHNFRFLFWFAAVIVLILLYLETYKQQMRDNSYILSFNNLYCMH